MSDLCTAARAEHDAVVGVHQLKKKHDFFRKKKNESAWMDIAIDDLLKDLSDDEADTVQKEAQEVADDAVCTETPIELDLDFDELLQDTVLFSTSEDATTPPTSSCVLSERRTTELKRLKRFGWQRVLEDKSSKRARYVYVDMSGNRETSLRRTMEAIRMSQTIETVPVELLREVTVNG